MCLKKSVCNIKKEQHLPLIEYRCNESKDGNKEGSWKITGNLVLMSRNMSLDTPMLISKDCTVGTWQ